MFKSLFIILSLLLMQNLAMANVEVESALKSYIHTQDSLKLKVFKNIPQIKLNCKQALYQSSVNPEGFCNAYLDLEIKKIKDKGFEIVEVQKCNYDRFKSNYMCSFRFN